MIPELKSSRSENNQNKCGVTCFQVVPGEKQIDWKISFKLKKETRRRGGKETRSRGGKETRRRGGKETRRRAGKYTRRRAGK